MEISSGNRRAGGLATTFMKVAAAIMLALGIGSAARAADSGLHNSTKTFSHPSQITPQDWSDPSEMHRTWLAGVARVPVGKGRSRRMETARLNNWRPGSGARLPAVIYLHGCSGVWPGTLERVRFMADLGFVVVAPASFARIKYAQSCDTKTNKASMYRGVIRIRQNDAAYAIRQIRKLPYVDPDRIVLMGLSQGGVTTATLSPQPGIAARIIEGWTCHAGWQEYKGLNARRSTPVLSLVGAQDPWFQTKWVRGNCGAFMRRDNGSVSLVYNSGRLAKEHELLDHANPRKYVVRFLKDQGFIE